MILPSHIREVLSVGVLLLGIGEIMKKGEALPIVRPEEMFKTVILEMSRKRLGAALVVEDSILQGIITGWRSPTYP